jgi:thymidylate synthase
MKVQMRSNDIFYGLTFDAPFFAFLQQSVYLKLKETYPELELGLYYHYADNLHFYERHFELADQIKATDIDVSKESTFMLKEPFLEYDGKEVTLSETAQSFVNEIDASVDNENITTKQDYKEILDKYFVTNGE